LEAFKLRVGFDIDGVLAKQDLEELLKASNSIPREQKIIEYFASCKPLLNPLHFCNPIYDKIFVITSREQLAIPATREWCAQHLPQYAKLIFACVEKWQIQSEIQDWFKRVAQEKAFIINGLNIEVYFEDIPEVVLLLRELCPSTKIIHYGGNY